MQDINLEVGKVVVSGSSAILVTGPGAEASYLTFAGVVVMCINEGEEGAGWPLGMYSDTWRAVAFESTDLNLTEIIARELRKVPAHVQINSADE
jgi:hypothetical protein